MKQKILNKAREYLGVKFVHQGRSKIHGVDCIGLVLCVLEELQIKIKNKNLNELDEKFYEKIPSSFLIQEKFESNLIDDNSGFIFLMRFGKFPQHAGFIDFQDGETPKLIHCYQQVGKVVEHNLDKNWQSKIVKIYRI